MDYTKHLLALAVLMLFVSCSSSDSEPEFPQSDADIVFMSTGGTKSMEVGADWIIDNPDEYAWCSAVISGTGLELTATANTDSESRQAVYSLSQGSTTKKIEVFQYPVAEIALSERPKAISKDEEILKCPSKAMCRLRC